MVGLSSWDALGTTAITDFLDEKLWTDLARRYSPPSIGIPAPTSFETLIRRRDDSDFPARIDVSRTNLPDGPAILLVVADCTEQKRLEARATQHEDRFRTLVESMSDWIWEVDAKGIYTYVSPQVVSILGYEPREMLGKSPFDFMTIAEATRVSQAFGALVAKKAPIVRLENTNLHKAGHSVVLETSGNPILSPSGDLLGYRGVDRDISVPRLEQKKLRQTENELNGFFDVALDLMCIAGLDGRFRRLNKQWEKTLGYNTWELLSVPFTELVHPEDLNPTLAMMALLSGGQAIVGFTNRYRCKDGSYRWLEWRSVPSGTLIYSAARDITERKAAADELYESKLMLQSVLDNIPQRVFWKGMDCRYLGGNKAFAADAGLSSPEAIFGKTDYDLVWKEFAARFNQDDLAVMQSGTAKLNYEEPLRVDDGPNAWVRTTKIPLRRRDGTIFGLLGTYEDITGQISVREELINLNLRFEIAAQSAGMGVWDWDVTQDHLYWDDRMYQLYGISARDFSGAYEAWTKGLHPGDQARCMKEIQQALDGEKEFDTEFRVVWPSGQIRVLKAHGRVMRDEGCRPVRMTGVNYDITERKRDEEQILRTNRELQNLYSLSKRTSESLELSEVLEQGQAILRDILDVHGSGIYLLKHDEETLELASSYGFPKGSLRQVQTMKVGEGLAGRAVQEKVPLSLCVQDHPDHQKTDLVKSLGFQTLLSIPLISAGTPIGAINLGLKSELSLSPDDMRLLQAIGQQLGISIRNAQLYQSISTELAHRTRMENQLTQATRQAEAASVAKSQFLANMSHEIRTPMNAIVGLGNLVMQTPLSPKQRDYIAKINASAHSLLGLINNILDLSKIEADRMNLEQREFGLSESLERVFSVITVQADAKGLEVLCHLDPRLPRTLVGDSLRLEQVLVNLLGNAIKFTDHGYILLGIHLDHLSKTDTLEVRFDITDTGIGLTPDQIGKLFHPFTQSDNSTTRRFGGTGLGLSICRRLVELMGGSIGVTSAPGQGSVFSFTARMTAGAANDKKLARALPSFSGKRVLVADDNQASRQIFRELLEDLGMDCVLVDSGQEVLAELEQSAADPAREYQLAILDHRLPDMEGMDVVARLRDSLSAVRTPIVLIVSAYGQEQVRQRARNLGVLTFLSKPVFPEVLRRTIGQTIFAPDFNLLPTEEEKQAEAAVLDGLRGAKILLVEDHPLNQQIASEFLERVGAVVKLAQNGQEAVDTVVGCDGKFDAILMDIQMPVLDGLAATRKLRERWSKERLPIIAMTAHAFEEDREQCRRAGMNAHIVKPIDISELYQTLARCIPLAAASETLPLLDSLVTPEALASLPAKLEGLDISDGLSRVCGNVVLFRKLVAEFATTAQALATKIDRALHEGEPTIAKEHCHTLKGLAGNLGAKGLREAAAALEQLVLENRLMETPPALIAVRQGVQAIVRAAQTLAQCPAEPATPNPAGQAVMDHVPVFRALAAKLRAHSMQAIDEAKQIQAALANGPHAADSAKLVTRVDNLDFPGAMVLLAQLAKALQVTTQEEP